MIGGDNESDTSDKKDVHENGAFPKTRYHVEGKPNGISVLQARQSFLKKQFRTKGLINLKIIRAYNKIFKICIVLNQ